MNIFYLDKSPILSAQYQADKHIVKMILESAQLLSSVQHMLNGPVKNEVYRLTHKNHPCAIWARSSKQNYDWLCLHGFALCHEYELRYEKIHKSREIIEKCFDNPPTFDYNEFTEPPQAMPEMFKNTDTVKAYRDYYYFCKYKGIGGDAIQMNWTKRGMPDWFLK